MSTMSLAEPWRVPAVPATPPSGGPPGDRVGFTGNRGAYWRLMIRGALLLAVTLGIYRFWLFTDMRRFLWANTEIDGESLEYTGTPIELLLGFLMALGILVPIYGLIFIGTLELELISQLSSFLGFTVLAIFGQYAIYRARRYRLTRTTLRGLRFRQTGSGWMYALRAVLWFIVNVLTLGLSYPWSAASLERYKMRNTWYGDLGGRFAGAGWRLFLRGSWIWLVLIAPLGLGLFAAGAMIDWPALARALAASNGYGVIAALGKIKSLKVALGIAGGTVMLTTLLAIFLYPVFQAIVMRWWLEGLRLGGAQAHSDLRIGRFYWAYFLYVVYVLAFTVGFFLVIAATSAAAAFAGIAMGVDLKTQSTGFTAVLTVITVVGYVVYLLGVSTIYQVALKFRLWEASAQSVTVSNLAALDNVRANDDQSNAVGEGLADALVGAGAI
jgi:uncharacterized membrane protein YjgN (DUF898 family)